MRRTLTLLAALAVAVTIGLVAPATASAVYGDTIGVGDVLAYPSGTYSIDSTSGRYHWWRSRDIS